MNGSAELWAKSYQNYLANFIRTGDPNGKLINGCSTWYLWSDWTGNSNNEDIKRKNYPGKVKVPSWNGKWFELGPTGKNGVQGKDERRKKCDMFDKLNEYMLHWDKFIIFVWASFCAKRQAGSFCLFL